LPAPAGWTPGLLAELDGYAAAIANWGRWGPDDQLGTLNLLTPRRRVAAAALVRTGTCLGLGRRIGGSPAPDNPVPGRPRGPGAEVTPATGSGWRRTASR
jgi:hypothetical protein